MYISTILFGFSLILVIVAIGLFWHNKKQQKMDFVDDLVFHYNNPEKRNEKEAEYRMQEYIKEFDSMPPLDK